jgi:hypothetical protein
MSSTSRVVRLGPWPLLALVALGSQAACPEREGATNKNKSPSSTSGNRHSKRALQSLPYLNWVPVKKGDRDKRGITRHDPGRAWRGLNLYNSRPRSKAMLIDMKGRAVQTWSSSLGQPTPEELSWRKIWPHLDFPGWEHVELAANADLLAIVPFRMVLRLDRRSRLVWSTDLTAHHDLDLAPDGTIYVLTAEKLEVTHAGQKLRLIDDHVVVLDPKGKPVRRFSLYRALMRHPTTARLLRAKLDLAVPQFRDNFKLYNLGAKLLQSKEAASKSLQAIQQLSKGTFKGTPRIELALMTSLHPMDPLHANSLEILPRDAAGLWKRGDLLLSIRELDLIVVLSPDGRRLRWSWGPGELQRQHHPSLLDNGNLLIFDNGQWKRRSRVLELDARTRKIVWSYVGSPPASFFSPIRGGCQRLQNGNTLIADSERGRIFEVTRDKQLVWEFFNPDLRGFVKKQKRAPIYRMVRFAPDVLTSGGGRQRGPSKR